MDKIMKWKIDSVPDFVRSLKSANRGTSFLALFETWIEGSISKCTWDSTLSNILQYALIRHKKNLFMYLITSVPDFLQETDHFTPKNVLRVMYLDVMEQHPTSHHHQQVVISVFRWMQKCPSRFWEISKLEGQLCVGGAKLGKSTHKFNSVKPVLDRKHLKFLQSTG